MLPEYREYERTVTTLVDAFVKPHMERYLRRVHDELGPDLRSVPFLVMQSSGGVASAGEVVRKPITTALSGPAAGALGSAVIAGIAGFPDIVTLDAGGTSTDLCLIEGGKPQVTNAGSVGPFPIRIPDDRHRDDRDRRRLDRLDQPRGPSQGRAAQRRRRAGPDVLSERRQRAHHHRRQSRARTHTAGAHRRRHRLDVARARDGLAALAKRLPGAMSAEELAHGIIEIANWSQANAIRQMTIQRGIDPRGFALLSFGGAGPAQSPAVMELLGMKACIVPLDPGNLSAPSGCSRSTGAPIISAPRSCTRTPPISTPSPAPTRRWSGRRRRRWRATASRPNAIRMMREADLRYAGQSMEVRVPAPAGAVDAAFLAALIDAFHAMHRRTFGYDYAGQQKVELVNFSVSGFGLIERPSLPKLAARAGRHRRTEIAPQGIFRWRVPRHADP